MAELHVLTGGGEERVVSLGEQPVTFGRDAECDEVIEEQRASRRHCTFHPDGKGWRVVDEGSSNGTYLGGKPVLAARLQPGDELEIGQTVLTYVAESVTPVRRRTPPVKRPPWGLLVLPIALGFAAYLGLGAYESASAETRERAWEAAARTVVQRADLPSQRAARNDILRKFEGSLPAAPAGARARAVLATALASGPAGPSVSRGSVGPALSDLRASWDHMAPVQRRARLAELLERHVDSPDAVAELRPLLERLAKESSRRTGDDRERTSRDAQRAAQEGRLADALDLWNGWLLRSPALDRDTEREVAAHLETIATQAKAAAETSLDEARRLAEGGDEDAATAHVEAALERLRGTGYDAWLAARTRDLTEDRPEIGMPVLDVARPGVSTTKERTLAMRALSSAEDLARLRLFGDAAQRLEQTLGNLTDPTLRGDVELRLSDLRAEARIVGAVLLQVQEEPRPFGPLRLDDGAWKVNGATENALLISRRDESAVRSLGELPAAVLSHLFRKARLDERQLGDAALVLWDVGEHEAYTEIMRRALVAEDDVLRNELSAVHARLNGRETPDGGYVPHPEADGGIITWDELKEIENREAIANFTKELEKVVASIESSPQAKQVARVRKAYAELEEARDFALELIFDEVQYFYPYRDRMKEYMPVKLEVDRRVKLVEEAWENGAKAKVKLDSKMEKLLERAEELRIEINYLSGSTLDLDERIAKVEMYLGHELSVRTFFETEEDLKLHEYNKAVMAENAVTETVATKDEREQVRITNDYRIMMGHRRALKIHDQLTHAARGHSEDMSRLGFFDHFSPVPGKRAPADRIRAEGYPLAGASENIHRGSGDPMGAHLSWRGSSGHHRNLLMPSWWEMGTGRDGRNWTQNFGFTEAHMHEY
jgi:uncharacterized protein YkwD